jgi:hypothetical protein
MTELQERAETRRRRNAQKESAAARIVIKTNHGSLASAGDSTKIRQTWATVISAKMVPALQRNILIRACVSQSTGIWITAFARILLSGGDVRN